MYRHLTIYLSIVFLISALTPAQSQPPSDFSQQLRVCEKHFKANRLVTGSGGTALACYREILKKDPSNTKALAGIEKIEARYITWINNALDKERLKKALRHLDRLSQVNPPTDTLSPAPNPEMSRLLQICKTHFEANRLTSGKGGSALACYQDILKKDPTNAQAFAGLKQIEARYVTWIKYALERRQQNKAKQYLAGLRTVKSQSPKSYKLPDNTAQMPETAQPAQLAQSTDIVEQVPVSDSPTTTILPPQEETPSPPTSVTTSERSNLIPEMVRIPTGRFRMGNTQDQGDDDEQPVHWVSIKRFTMSRYEVTFAQYDNFAQATGRKKPNDEGWGRGNRPVINVSLEDATAYTQWLSQQTGQKYRLPTEAEWEYAARAKTKTDRYWGNNPDQACDYANVWDKSSQKENPHWKWITHNCTDGYAYTAPVGRFKPNAFGLFDMLGNVWEWVCSEYEETYSGKEQTCVKGNNLDKLYIVRGGSWSVGPRLVRAALRSRDVPGNRNYHVGFRIVRR